MRLYLLSLAAGSCLLAASAPREVTFHKDVEPILQARCQGCHRPGEAAPMALLTYQEARPWSKAIKQAVLVRKMPPWYASEGHVEFANDRRLSQSEIDTLVGWVDSGAKEGDSKDAPKPISFAEGWSIGKPDLVVEMPVSYHVPVSGTIDYTYFVMPTNFTEDKWVERVEVRAGNKSVVHHIVAFVRPPGVKFLEDAPYGEAYVPEKKAPKRKPDDGTGSFAFTAGPEILGSVAPGTVPNELQPGQARLIPKGADLILQMHYTANGKAAGDDRSRVGIIFAKQPPKERVVNTYVGNGNLHIPPMAADHAVTARVTLYEETTLLSMTPHMHVRGKSFEYKATYPTGETEILLTVPKYDFSWQLTYYLKQPKVLPKGTVLECVAHYDNSPNNPSNPDPKSDVYWGDQTWEEMLAGFVDFAIPMGTNLRDVTAPKKKPAAGGSSYFNLPRL